MAAPAPPGPSSELLTQLQDQMDMMSRQFFEAVGVLQRDAPPLAGPNERLLATPPVPGFDAASAAADMAERIVATATDTHRLLQLLPDDLGRTGGSGQGGEAWEARVASLSQQHTAAREELAATVKEAEAGLQQLQGLHAALAHAALRPATRRVAQ
jgi:Subunit 21 of Mediator complex